MEQGECCGHQFWSAATSGRAGARGGPHRGREDRLRRGRRADDSQLRPTANGRRRSSPTALLSRWSWKKRWWQPGRRGSTYRRSWRPRSSPTKRSRSAPTSRGRRQRERCAPRRGLATRMPFLSDTPSAVLPGPALACRSPRLWASLRHLRGYVAGAAYRSSASAPAGVCLIAQENYGAHPAASAEPPTPSRGLP